MYKTAINITFLLNILIILHNCYMLTASESIDECNSSCNDSASTCFCSHCDLYSDCCEKIITKTEEFAKFECNIKTSDTSFTYSLKKCPNKWNSRSSKNKQLQEYCETPDGISDDIKINLLKRIPVFSHSINISYQNIFCAKCNGKDFEEDDLEFFKLKPDIEDLIKYRGNITQDAAADILTNNSKKIFKLSTNVHLRECFRSVDYCPDNGTFSGLFKLKNIL